MKRRWVHLWMLLLLLGVLTSYFVSWGIKLYWNYRDGDLPLSQSTFPQEPLRLMRGPLRWPIAVPSNWAARPTSAAKRREVGYLSSHYRYSIEILHGQEMSDISVQRWGLPFLGVQRWRVNPEWTSQDLRVPSALTNRLGSTLPIIPVWPGFVLNAVVYAAAWAVVLLGPGWVRRFRMKRRGRLGLCEKCGYCRTGIADGVACPECGN